MRNKEEWVSSKYEYKRGKWIASRNSAEVVIGSRLMADLIAGCYDAYIKEYCRGYLADLGCGKVPLYGIYRYFISDSVCIDWGNSLHQNIHVDIESNLSNRLPIKSDVFDTIILSDVLEHISEPEQLWAEMYRILKPDGILMLTVPFMYGVHEEPFDYFRYTEYSLRLFAHKTGFEVIILDSMGGGAEVMANLAAKLFKYLPVLGDSLSILVQNLTEFFIKTGIGQNLSKTTKYRYSLGYFMVAKKQVDN